MFQCYVSKKKNKKKVRRKMTLISAAILASQILSNLLDMGRKP